jgi:hypothetical protein
VIRQALATGGTLALGPALMRFGPAVDGALAAPTAHLGPGPYGALQPSDPSTGVQVPKGFTVREIARGGAPLGTTGYVFPPFPDGSGSHALPDGGWLFAVNSEVPDPGEFAGTGDTGQRPGGASAIRFDKNGQVVDAYRILDGTRGNCGGGITPWQTWLSGEEVENGRVWEADLTGQKAAVARPALGVFSHEYACVHEADRRVYETEDDSGGGFYRFTPAKWGDLSKGVLEIATLRPDGVVEWRVVPDPTAASKPTRQQVPQASKLARPEGLCIRKSTGIVYFVESSASRVYAYDPRTETYEKLYAEADFKEPILTDADNIAVSERSGDLFVCEDAGDFDICLLTPAGELSRFVHMDGPQHGDPTTDASSETTGPSFDPSGTRLYFSSQRAYVSGAVYEITGPFRTLPAAGSATPGGEPTTPGGPSTGTESPPPELKLRIHAYRRTLRSRIRRHGMRVGIAASEVADLVAVLRAPVGAKGSQVTLAVAMRKTAPADKAKLTLKPTRKGKAYLSRPGRQVTATITATATTTDGKRAVATRSLVIR